jgi:hypothetical protein
MICPSNLKTITKCLVLLVCPESSQMALCKAYC